MIKTRKRETKQSILKKLDAEENRIRKSLLADVKDFEELQSGWQECDSPAERNLREVEWGQFSVLQKELGEVEDAKQKLADGIYGLCEECGVEISVKRLAAIPGARRCLVCQEQTERNPVFANRSFIL